MVVIDWHVLPGASESEPGDTVGVKEEVIVGEGSNGLTTVINAALVSIIMIANAQVRTPDGNVLMARKDTVEARKVAVPTPEVIVVIIDVINRSCDNFTIRVQHPSVELTVE